jgi:hypothetical protein
MIRQIDIDAGADHIVECFKSDKPFFIGRNGSTEMEALKTGFSQAMAEKLQRYSGIFPATQKSFEAWVQDYTYSMGYLDGAAAGWYAPHASFENNLLDRFCPGIWKTPLRSLEPYYVDEAKQWSRCLAGKRVAVVSSFAETIKSQLQKREQIWPNGLLPEAEWIPVRTYFPPDIAMGDETGWPEATCWQEAVDTTVLNVLRTGATVALIGCGALGMCIGARLRRAGISCILLGGAVQVLFGIKGSRWERHDVISKFWNSAWVYPSFTETPTGANKIEGACYWGGSRPSTTPR